MTNKLSHPYHLDESTFTFRGIRRNLYFLFPCMMNFLCANRIAPDGMPHFVTSDQGLFCLSKDTRLIPVKAQVVIIEHDVIFIHICLCLIYIKVKKELK